MKWNDVKDGLPDEEISVLVLLSGNDVCETLIMQCSLFQGNFYPDHLDGIIDLDDAVFPLHWAHID